jgi:hypothetical protein
MDKLVETLVKIMYKYQQGRASAPRQPQNGLTREEAAKYDPILRSCRQKMAASLEQAKKDSLGATEASLVALAVGLRTAFEMLDVLDKGTFVTPRSLVQEPESKSRSKARRNIQAVERAMF